MARLVDRLVTSPRLHHVPRRHHEVGPVGAALRAATPQRHVAAASASIDDRSEVGVRLALA
jgi:hypothetical protein